MLRVMVVDEDNERRQVLRQGLERAGHYVVAEVQSTISLSQLVAQVLPDVIIIDTQSPDRDTIEHLCVISQDTPRPIMMFSADGNTEKIREAVRAGVSAYVVDGLAAQRVQPILDRLLDRAQGILIKQKNLSEEEAYKWLRKMAMNENLKLAEVAGQVTRAAKLLL